MSDTSNDTTEDEVKQDKILSKHFMDGRTYNLMKNDPDYKSTTVACDKCIFLDDTRGCSIGYNICKEYNNSYFTEVKLTYSKGHYNKRDEFILPIPRNEQVPEVNKENKGIKFDDGKIQWWYLPIEPIKEVLKVLHYGDKKYPADDGCNWKRVPNAKKRYYSALMRHITAWWDEEKNDQESGMHHLAHACTNVLFLLYFEMKGYPEDKKYD